MLTSSHESSSHSGCAYFTLPLPVHRRQSLNAKLSLNVSSRTCRLPSQQLRLHISQISVLQCRKSPHPPPPPNPSVHHTSVCDAWLHPSFSFPSGSSSLLFAFSASSGHDATALKPVRPGTPTQLPPFAGPFGRPKLSSRSRMIFSAFRLRR